MTKRLRRENKKRILRATKTVKRRESNITQTVVVIVVVNPKAVVVVK